MHPGWQEQLVEHRFSHRSGESARCLLSAFKRFAADKLLLCVAPIVGYFEIVFPNTQLCIVSKLKTLGDFNKLHQDHEL